MRAPRSVLLRARTALVIAILALAGCASTPQATPERDAEAKRFLARPDAATIYVYRSEPGAVEPDTENNTVLYVDGRLIGTTLALTFFRFDTQAGQHLLHGFGNDQGTLKLDTRSGEIYFVSLYTTGGVSHFKLVTPENGKRDILRCCTLLENWAPSQRPFLR
jgi:hypothetical protein